MTPEVLRTIVNRRPFEAVRIKTVNGESFEISRREMVLFAKNSVLIVRSDLDGTPTDIVDYISYHHVATVERLGSEAA